MQAPVEPKGRSRVQTGSPRAVNGSEVDVKRTDRCTCRKIYHLPLAQWVAGSDKKQPASGLLLLPPGRHEMN